MVANRWKLFGLTTLLSALLAACGGGGGAAGAGSQVSPAAIAAAPVTQAAVAGSPQRVGMGINGLSYFDRSFSMADLGRESQLFTLDWTKNVGADANGYPGRDFQLIFSSTKIGAGTYKLSFTGRATVTAGGAGVVQNASYDAGTNTSKADLVLPNDATGNTWLVFNDTYRTSTSTKGDGVTNIHLWRPGYPTDGSVTFTNEFVAAMEKLNLIRGMEFFNTNTNPQVAWAERTKPNFFGTIDDYGQSWELMIALGNATGRDVWLNVPVRANDDYIRKLAQLVKYGSDGNLPYTATQDKPVYAPLKPGLRVYLEYGNELWNPGYGFMGYGWALALANANKGDVTQPIAFDGPQSDSYAALRRWIAYRSSFISLTFRDVFGDSAMMSTVRPILASQVGNANAYLSDGLAWAQAFYGQVRSTPPLNPVARAPSDIWYGAGGAAYYDSTIDPQDASSATMSAYFANLPSPSFAQAAITDSIWAHGYGLKYVSYEGGPGPGGSMLGSAAGAALSAAYNNDPRMKDRMLVAQDIWDQAGGDQLVYYVYSGSSPWSFTNELVQQVVSDTSSVKLQAIDAINAKARPTVTLGTLTPATIHLKDASAQTIAADSAPWALNNTAYLLRPGVANPAPFILLPIRTATAGNYKVSINVGTVVAGTVALYANGTYSGTIALTPSLATNTVTTIGATDTLSPTTTASTTVSSTVSVSLPAGLSVLRLDNPQSSSDIFVQDVVVQ